MSDSLDRRRILVVDDEERMVRFIRMNLEHDGFQVSEAFNGKQAIQRIRDVTPDLILLDVMMPDMDGWEVYQQMKADQTTRNIPVIVVTAKAQNIDKVLGLHIAKVDDYIAKPFGPQELMDSVERIIGQKATS